MENEINTNATHIGRKIERIRRLRRRFIGNYKTSRVQNGTV